MPATPPDCVSIPYRGDCHGTRSVPVISCGHTQKGATSADDTRVNGRHSDGGIDSFAEATLRTAHRCAYLFERHAGEADARSRGDDVLVVRGFDLARRGRILRDT